MRTPALLVAPLALLAAACGSSSSSSSPASSATPTTTGSTSASSTTRQAADRITTQRVQGGIGAVLTDGQGRAVYVFLPEKGGKIACTGGCASTWPPLKVASGVKPVATAAVHPRLLGTVADPSGGAIITYAGWPLHTYVGDTARGQYNGQGYAGKWYLISPSGTTITKSVSSTTTSTSGGYGSGSSPY